MESWRNYDGVAAIEGLEKPSRETGIVDGDGVSARGIEKGIVLYHVGGHIIGPFEYLGTDVDHECIGGPTSEDHDLGHRVIHEK